MPFNEPLAFVTVREDDILPFANNCLDYLVRTNIAEELQGRAWGLIGFLSQIGYVVAYGLSGLLADGMGNGLQIGVGRGAAAVIMASGVLLGMIALGIYHIKAVRELEKGAHRESKNPVE